MIQAEMVIAQCSYCGAQCFSWDKEDAIYKLSKHKCTVTLADKEIMDILAKVINQEQKHV